MSPQRAFPGFWVSSRIPPFPPPGEIRFMQRRGESGYTFTGTFFSHTLLTGWIGRCLLVSWPPLFLIGPSSSSRLCVGIWAPVSDLERREYERCYSVTGRWRYWWAEQFWRLYTATGNMSDVRSCQPKAAAVSRSRKRGIQAQHTLIPTKMIGF